MDISAQQTILLRQIKEKQGQINEIFRQLQMKQSDIFNKQQSTSKPKSELSSSSQFTSNPAAYLQKYSNYSIDQIRKNYNDAMSPFKWFQLPFCKTIIYEKMLFCVPSSAIILTTFYIWKKMGDKNFSWNFKQSMGRYAGLTLALCGAVFMESLIFQPYCDINSHHYNSKLSNIEIARLLKKQYLQYDKNAFNFGRKQTQ